MQNKPNFIDLLPPELSCRIFSLLDFHSFLEASKAYDSWNGIMSHNDLLWKPHCLKLVPQEDIDNGRQNGNSWRNILMNWRTELKNKWMEKESQTEDENKEMFPFDAETWGKIHEAQM